MNGSARNGAPALLLAVLAAASLGACRASETEDNVAAPAADGGTQVRNATGGALQDRSFSSPEERLYVEKCGICHRQMGMGTVILARRMDPKLAILENRTDLTEELVIQIAREGLGNMPRIQRGEVSDPQLRTIARYLAKGNRQ
jgi:cytochrome c553